MPRADFTHRPVTPNTRRLTKTPATVTPATTPRSPWERERADFTKAMAERFANLPQSREESMSGITLLAAQKNGTL